MYYDELLDRAVSKFVPADDLIVPYTATSLEDADAIVHVLKISENDLRKKQVAGFYRDVEITPGYSQETEVEKKERELEGTRKTRDEQMFTILEFHTNIDLEGFEDKEIGRASCREREKNSGGAGQQQGQGSNEWRHHILYEKR